MPLDFAFGIFATIFANHYYGVDIFPFILIALLFSVLPDLDFLISRIFKIHPDKGYKHRELFHYPLIYLPAGFLLLLPFSKLIAVTFLIISFFHFIHDSIAYGRGVQWLYPFSKSSYAFFYVYSRVEKWGLWQWIWIFDEKTTKKFDEEHGDENWIQNIYYKFHPIVIFEFGVFLIALILLFCILI